MRQQVSWNIQELCYLSMMDMTGKDTLSLAAQLSTCSPNCPRSFCVVCVRTSAHGDATWCCLPLCSILLFRGGLSYWIWGSQTWLDRVSSNVWGSPASTPGCWSCGYIHHIQLQRAHWRSKFRPSCLCRKLLPIIETVGMREGGDPAAVTWQGTDLAFRRFGGPIPNPAD